MERWSRGWSHDITELQPGIVQPSTATDFPHTPRHVTGGEIYSHAAEMYPTIFLHNCRQQREKKRRFTVGAVQWTAENTGAAPYGRNQREARPSALPDLHALGADSRPFFWFVLCNCPLTVGMRRKRKVQNTLQRCQLAVVNSWAESQRLRFKDGVTSRNNIWTSKSPGAFYVFKQ